MYHLLWPGVLKCSVAIIWIHCNVCYFISLFGNCHFQREKPGEILCSLAYGFQSKNQWCGVIWNHCIEKSVLTFWFSTKEKKANYSFFHKKREVNNRLRNIKPNLNLARIPRSLDDLVHWKASEFRNFLLFWRIPVLQDIPTVEYYAHFCLLVKAHLLTL